jgi:hypothetical protein
MFVCATRKPGTPVLKQLKGDLSLEDRSARVLSDEPFLSVRKIAKKVMLSKSTFDAGNAMEIASS